VREITTTDWFLNEPVRMPVGIAELGIDGLAAAAPTGDFDSGCRRDLLTVDNIPVGVDITGSIADANAANPLSIALCGDDIGGLQLGTGDHVLRAAKGIDTGFDLDRLVLQSAADGRSPDHIQPLGPDRPPAPEVAVTSEGRTDLDLTVTNPRPGTPYWLVLGQSHNDGWTASADGHDLGPPQLVDGYANGWLISTPADVVHVRLRWTPQRFVWICLFLSALGVLLCLALVIRRPPAPSAEEDALPEPSRWRTFARYPTRDAPRSSTALAITIGSGLATAAIVGPIAGLVTAFVALVATRRARARWWLALGAPGLLAASGLYVLGRQARSRPTAAFEWPAEQGAVHQVAWLAVIFLVVLFVVDAVWDKVTRRRSDVAAAASGPPGDVSLADDVPDFPP